MSDVWGVGSPTAKVAGWALHAVIQGYFAQLILIPPWRATECNAPNTIVAHKTLQLLRGATTATACVAVVPQLHKLGCDCACCTVHCCIPAGRGVDGASWHAQATVGGGGIPICNTEWVHCVPAHAPTSSGSGCSQVIYPLTGAVESRRT
jgi:hypothetical protein